MRKLKLKELGRISVEAYQDVKKISLVVVLDDIRSAHNVGSIFRTADAMAIERIILCGITPQPPSREITKTAIGATESVAWSYHESIGVTLAALKEEGYFILAIEQTNMSIELMNLNVSYDKVAIILGNEVHGVGEEALRYSDKAVEIAQYGTKHSLNVSICGGIVMHHIAQGMR